MPQITVETKNIWQDSVQNRVDEQSDDVAVPQIPEEPDEATWLIPLKRVCAQIVDVPVTRVQEHLAEVSWRSSLNRLSDSERYANRQIVDCHVAQYQRNSSEYHVALGDFPKSACEIAPWNMFACVRDERTGGRREGLFQKSVCVGVQWITSQHACAHDVVLEL